MLDDITVDLVGSSITVDVDDIDAGTTDNCGSVTLTPDTFTFDCSNIGPNMVNVTVTDDSGNTTNCSATITVVDMTMVNCVTVGDTTVFLDDTGMANITPDLIDGGSSTGCGGTPILSVTPIFAGCNNLGFPLTVTLTVSDASGNSATCTATVEVMDTIAPTIMIDDITIECEEFGIADFGTPIVTDNCDQSFPPSVTIVSDSTDLNVCGIGTLVRIITAVDNMNNTTIDTQYVEIEGPDTPFGLSNISFPAMDTTLTCEAAQNGLLFTGTVGIDLTGVDCSLITIDSTTITTSTVGCPDTLEKTWTIVDSCQFDNAGAGVFSFTQTIIVVDTLAPVITGPIAQGDTIFAPADLTTCTASLVLGGSVTDCSSFTVTNNSPFADDNNSADASGEYEVGTTNITITATDQCGNTSSYDYVVVVEDTTALSFMCVKLFLDIPDTLTIPVLAEDYLILNGFDCEDPDLLVATYTFGDFNDTLVVADCSFLQAGMGAGDTTYFVYVYYDGVFIDSCKTLLTIEDPNGFCPTTLTRANITGNIHTVKGEALPNTYVRLEGSPMDDMSDTAGDYSFMDMPTGGSYRIVPTNDTDHKRGVSTLDLILIQRHILGIAPFDQAHQYVAADINASGSISGVDVVELRKLILGKVSHFANNTSFRMLDDRQEFDRPEDALVSAKEYKMVPVFNHHIRANFTGVKVGDVN